MTAFPSYSTFQDKLLQFSIPYGSKDHYRLYQVLGWSLGFKDSETPVVSDFGGEFCTFPCPDHEDLRPCGRIRAKVKTPDRPDPNV